MKKGFTLIELLAVIVILAIIALIATPIVLNIIKDSRESAGLRSAEMYLKGVETSVATAIIHNKKVQDGLYPIMPEGDVCLGTLQVSNETTTCNGEVLEVEMNGETPQSGTVTIASGKITNLSFTYSNGKTIVKNDEKLVYSDEKNETGKVEYTAYSVGDTVTIGTENFYVLKDSDETNSTVTLLAKDCIVVDETSEKYLKQDATAGTVAFSSKNYWSSETQYPLNLNDYPIPEGTASIITTVKEYGTKVGGMGRLMTEEEAEALKTANSDILWGRNGESSSEFLIYWLASTNYSNYVSYVSGYVMSIMGTGIYDASGDRWVRPVVEISKDKIS